ncbi:MAG TPA: hypothetical protein VEC12_10885, partial [Bacteroidia bacterium]|nr:hypothetical protein [Bacteroidia bacterium]
EGKSLLIKKAAKKREQKEELPGKEETTQEPPSEATTNEIAETGMGLVIDKNFPDANKNIALHVSAQVGTIVKITNPANNREVYVRVVGQLKTDAKGVIIMISPEAANQLGASLTEKVKLTLSYTR